MKSTRDGMATGEVRGAASEADDRRALWRVVWISGLAIAIAIGIDLMLGAGQRDRDRAAHTSTSRESHGFYAFHHLLVALGFDVERHRGSYARLPEPTLSVLLRLAPLPAQQLEAVYADKAQSRMLREWVEAGGHLVTTTAALPMLRAFGVDLRSHASTRDVRDQVLTGALGQELPATEFAELDRDIVGLGDLHGLRVRLRGLDAQLGSMLSAYATGDPPEVRVFAEAEPTGWQVDAVNGAHPLGLVQDLGRGRIWLLASPLPFSNTALGRCGTAPLAVATVHSASQDAQRTLFIDEYCHGLGVAKGAWHYVWHGDLFYPVLGALCCLLLIGWRGAIRLGVPRPARTISRRSVEEYIVSLADLARRGGKFQGAANSIAQTYRHRIAGTNSPALDRVIADIRNHRSIGARELANFDVAARRAYREAREPDHS